MIFIVKSNKIIKMINRIKIKSNKVNKILTIVFNKKKKEIKMKVLKKLKAKEEDQSQPIHCINKVQNNLKSKNL
jgi:hypothetical protein